MTKYSLLATGVFVSLIFNAAAYAQSTGADQYFVGRWRNVDPSTRDVTRIDITRDASIFGEFRAHALAKCSPKDCDWGNEPAVINQSGNRELSVVYTAKKGDMLPTLIANIHLTMRPNASGGLNYELVTDFVEPKRPVAVAHGRLKRF